MKNWLHDINLRPMLCGSTLSVVKFSGQKSVRECLNQADYSTGIISRLVQRCVPVQVLQVKEPCDGMSIFLR
jgi:hypothetical protein